LHAAGRTKVIAQARDLHAAAEVLVTVSCGANLLVVGSRGRGAFADMLLGSASLHCAQNADCPVVIVRHQRQ
jgi:nucleotide-binding universal stress UspA family protein